MTAIAGFVNLGARSEASRRETDELLAAMLAHLVGSEPRGLRVVTGPHGGFARGTARCGREPDAPRVANAVPTSDGVVVVADARIDDDEACDAAWRAGVDPRAESPDERAIRSAYERHGDDCAQHLRGDYAFALFDPRAQKLLLSRALLGTRTLYYLEETRGLRFASEAHALFADGAREPEPNLESIARFLVNDYSDNGPTLWRDVVSVHPGTTVVLTLQGLRTMRHAALEPVEPLLGLGDEAYAERVAEALGRAVRRRILRSKGVGVTLSGGLDSSSVACVAEQERRRLGLTHEPVVALHSRYGNLACDETPSSLAVVRRWGLRSVEHDTLADPSWSAPSRALQAGAPPYYPSAFAFDALFDAAGACQLDTVLTGEGGDLCLARTPFDFVEPFKSGNARSVVRQAFQPLFSMEGLRRGYDLTLRQAIPWRLRASVRRFKRAGHDAILTDRWHEALEQRRLERELAWESAPRGDLRTATLLRWVHGAGQQFCSARLGYFARRRGLTLEHPFLDEPLVRLLLSLPSEQRNAPLRRKPKPVLRRAMRDLLPAKVYRRQNSAEYSSFVRTCLDELHRDALSAVMRPERLIDLGVLRPEVRLGSPDASPLPLFYRKLAAIAMELWLRQLRP